MAVPFFRLLTRLQFRQFFRRKNKGLVGSIIIVSYFWLLEIVLFFILREEGVTDFPLLLVAAICLSLLVPDAVFKLIFEHDQTVMDAFLKTRPIPQGSWDRFLSFAQFWKASNLMLPLSMMPACFLFLPFGWGLAVLLALYLLSVFGGFLVMLAKHRGRYQLEDRVSAKAGRSFRQGSGHHVFGIQSRSFLRSKRLKFNVISLTVVFLLQFLLRAGSRMDGFAATFLSFTILYPVLGLPQFGMGIEAAFFSGIWTRPLSISRLLSEKYLFSVFLGGVTALVLLPCCLWLEIPLYAPVSFALFHAGVSVLVILVDAYNCVPFDLFGKTRFNSQGFSSTFKASAFVAMVVAMGFPVLLILVLPGWIAYLVLAVLGLTGIAIHRPYFRWVERNFLKNRYKYMERYQSI